MTRFAQGCTIIEERERMNEKFLKSMMVLQNISEKDLARMLNMSHTTLRQKLRNNSEFTVGESLQIKEILNLSNRDYEQIFFLD